MDNLKQRESLRIIERRMSMEQRDVIFASTEFRLSNGKFVDQINSPVIHRLQGLNCLVALSHMALDLRQNLMI